MEERERRRLKNEGKRERLAEDGECRGEGKHGRE